MRNMIRDDSSAATRSKQNMRSLFVAALWVGMFFLDASARGGVITVSNLNDFAEVAARDGQIVKLQPGVYRLADYLTEEVLQKIRAGVDRTQRRPPVPMFTFQGNGNRF